MRRIAKRIAAAAVLAAWAGAAVAGSGPEKFASAPPQPLPAPATAPSGYTATGQPYYTGTNYPAQPYTVTAQQMPQAPAGQLNHTAPPNAAPPTNPGATAGAPATRGPSPAAGIGFRGNNAANPIAQPPSSCAPGGPLAGSRACR